MVAFKAASILRALTMHAVMGYNAINPVRHWPTVEAQTALTDASNNFLVSIDVENLRFNGKALYTARQLAHGQNPSLVKLISMRSVSVRHRETPRR